MNDKIIWGNTALGESDDLYIMDDAEWDYTGSEVNFYYNKYREYYIDAGANTVPILPALDFEGDPRIIDGDYNGSAIVDVGADENDGSMPVPVFAGNDFTGNGISDISVWRLSNGMWYINGLPAVAWGKVGDIPVNGDYDGDGTTEVAVWRPSNGKWYINGIGVYSWGLAGDMPLVR